MWHLAEKEHCLPTRHGVNDFPHETQFSLTIDYCENSSELHRKWLILRGCQIFMKKDVIQIKLSFFITTQSCKQSASVVLQKHHL